MNVPVSLWKEKTLLEKINREQYLLGIFLGILLVMVFYNFFIFIFIRDLSYLYYVLLLLTYMFLMISLTGTGFEFLFPYSPWWFSKSIPFFTSLMMVFIYLFTGAYLNISTLYNRINLFYKTGTGISLVLIPLSLVLPYHIIIQVATAFALVTIIIITLSVTMLLVKKYHPAKYFLLSFVSFAIGILLYIFKAFGVLPTMVLTEYGVYFGASAMVTLLSIGLADRINVMRNEKEAAQQTALQNLIRNDKLKDELLSNFSHELNTPVATILMNSEMLLDGDIGGELQQDCYAQLYTDALKLKSLIFNIMLVFKIDNQELTFHPVIFSLKELLQEIIKSLQGLYRGKKHTFEIPREDLQIRNDREKTEIILRELIKNAYIFSAPNGKTEVKINRQGQDLEVTIADNGIGVEEKMLSRLSEKFFRIDASISYKESGTGLGLYIADRLSRFLGGRVKLESNDKNGVTARFFLPQANE